MKMEPSQESWAPVSLPPIRSPSSANIRSSESNHGKTTNSSESASKELSNNPHHAHQHIVEPTKWTLQYLSQARCEYVQDQPIQSLLARYEDVENQFFNNPRRKAMGNVFVTSEPYDRDDEAGGRASRALDSPQHTSGSATHSPMLEEKNKNQKKLTVLANSKMCSSAEAQLQQQFAMDSSNPRQIRPLRRYSNGGSHRLLTLPDAIAPSRFLFDRTRWSRSCRCEYCQQPGGELECAVCDVIAHAKCFFKSLNSTAEEQEMAAIYQSLQSRDSGRRSTQVASSASAKASYVVSVNDSHTLRELNATCSVSSLRSSSPAACLGAGIHSSPSTSAAATLCASSAPMWLCALCSESLQEEYHENSHVLRVAHIRKQQAVYAKVVIAYVRMSKDALLFRRKKRAAVLIQSAVRGRLARVLYRRMLRNWIKPYTLQDFHIRTRWNAASLAVVTSRITSRISARSSSTDATAEAAIVNPDSNPTGRTTAMPCAEDIRLVNGFSCNPYLVISIVDGADDEQQLFYFETSVHKIAPSASDMANAQGSSNNTTNSITSGLAGTITTNSTSRSSLSASAGVDESVAQLGWNKERFLVPGINGNATFCFTLLSKNGPNNFFLGQAVLRFRCATSELWKHGGWMQLPLRSECLIAPKASQGHLLNVVDVGGLACAVDMELQVNLKPFCDATSFCGFMSLKTAAESSVAVNRWCVLADNVLRVYRQYGVTVPTEVLEMARAMEVKIVKEEEQVLIQRKLQHNAQHQTQYSATSPKHLHHTPKGSDQPLDSQFITVQYMNRVFYFQCERLGLTRLWFKRLQGAMKSTSTSAIANDPGGSNESSTARRTSQTL